jgi:serine/threonine-protein kinase SRPK3
MRRFERIYNVVEPVEEYRVGGYHPVHIEDTFHHRYRIVGKWAFGQFSTVWLAKDTRLYSLPLVSYFVRDYHTYTFPSSRLETYVTLKILKADVSSNSRELSILLHLSRPDTYHPGKNHVLQLLDHFEHKGPNGLHLCLVFPVMMSDGEAMTVRGNPRYSGYVREISNQILLGLNYLHDQGLVHGGMHLWAQMLKPIHVDL